MQLPTHDTVFLLSKLTTHVAYALITWINFIFKKVRVICGYNRLHDTTYVIDQMLKLF